MASALEQLAARNPRLAARALRRGVELGRLTLVDAEQAAKAHSLPVPTTRDVEAATRPGSAKADLRGCSGCRQNMLSAVKAASGPAPAPTPPPQKIALILSREDGWCHKEKAVADALAAAGWRVEAAKFNGPMHGVPAWMEKHGVKPLATISWEEHGRQFFNLRMKNYANWALDNGIAPCHMDLAYLDHTKTFILDFYGRDGWGLINLDWPSLSGAPVDWSKYPRLAEYVKGFQTLYAESAAMPPLPGLEPGYVVFWTQISNHLSKLKGRWTEFLPKLDAMLRKGGNRLVVKTGPMRPKNMPDNLCVIAHDRSNPHQNSQLIRFAKYHILTCSSVSNELILAGAPVMATGRTRFSGKGVFCEADTWGDINMVPGINLEARNRYLRWWAENEVYPEGIPARLNYVIGRAMAYAKAEASTPAPASEPAPVVITTTKHVPCTTVTTIYVNDESSERVTLECLDAIKREFPDSPRIAAIDYAPPGFAERVRDMGFDIVTVDEGEPPRMSLLLRESVRRATTPVILTVECDVILSTGFGQKMRDLFTAFSDQRVFAIEATTTEEDGTPCYPVNDRLGKRRQPKPYGTVAGFRLVRDMMYPTFSVTAFRRRELGKVDWKTLPPLVWADKYLWWQVGRGRIAVIAPELKARHYKKVARRAAAGVAENLPYKGVEAVHA